MGEGGRARERGRAKRGVGGGGRDTCRKTGRQTERQMNCRRQTACSINSSSSSNSNSSSIISSRTNSSNSSPLVVALLGPLISQGP